MEKIKKCFKCSEVKVITDFYPHKQMGDGYLNKCILCAKNDEKLRQKKLRENPEYVERERKRGRDKYYRLNYKERKIDPKLKKKTMEKYIHNYPEKRIIKKYMSSLKPLIKGNNLHHWSYNLEHAKDVIELSIKDHNKAHRFLVYDQEYFMYRRNDTMELLDTREKHENYINYVIENKE